MIAVASKSVAAPHGANAGSPRGWLIIIGASTRAAAQSAIRAGYSPWCIDLFADRDLRAIAPVKKCPRENWPDGALDLLKDAPPGPVLLTGAMENHIEVVRKIESKRPLLSSSSQVMIVTRDRDRLAKIARDTWGELVNENVRDGRYDYVDGPHCPDYFSCIRWGERLAMGLDALIGRKRWLQKMEKRAGGRGITRWKWRDPIAADSYVEQWIDGTPICGVFNGESLVGISVQIAGDAAFGAAGFEYVGNIGPVAVPPRILLQMTRFGQRAVSQFGLRGLFGVDAIATHSGVRASNLGECDCLFILEINPRYPASVEIHERARPVAALSVAEPSTPAVAGDVMLGKAIVCARSRLRVPDLCEHFTDHQIADVPDVGDVIAQGHPVCTVFARGSTGDECDAGLRLMAEKVYTRLTPA